MEKGGGMGETTWTYLDAIDARAHRGESMRRDSFENLEEGWGEPMMARRGIGTRDDDGQC